MAKADLKTIKSEASVLDFLNQVEDPNKRADSLEVHYKMEKITGEQAKMWGSSIIGYGTCHLKYESGRELDWMLTGFSPRKHNLTLYIMSGFGRYDELLDKLGKYKIGKSCLYLKSLQDVDKVVLTKLIKSSVEHMRKVHA